MQYRPFGKLDLQVSALGFGAMRLPVIGNDKSNIDAPLAMDMIRTAIDHGVNYVDTAYPYHQGQSEFLVGRALQEGLRGGAWWGWGGKGPPRERGGGGVQPARAFDRVGARRES